MLCETVLGETMLSETVLGAEIGETVLGKKPLYKQWLYLKCSKNQTTKIHTWARGLKIVNKWHQMGQKMSKQIYKQSARKK